MLDTVQFYVELGAMQLGLPYIQASNAMHADYSGHTPLCLYGWPHETTPAALARNREGVTKFLKILERGSAGIRAHAESTGLKIDWEDPGYTLSPLASITQTPTAVLESLAQGVPQVAIPVTYDQPGVAARIADKKTGVVTSLDKLTADHLSTLLNDVLNESSYRNNARKLQKIIADTRGLSVAADLVEKVLGVSRNSNPQP